MANLLNIEVARRAGEMLTRTARHHLNMEVSAWMAINRQNFPTSDPWHIISVIRLRVPEIYISGKGGFADFDITVNVAPDFDYGYVKASIEYAIDEAINQLISRYEIANQASSIMVLK